jgi:hypothetical protein
MLGWLAFLLLLFGGCEFAGIAGLLILLHLLFED